MDSFVSGVAQNLLANWIGYLLSVLLGTVIAAWGKMEVKWSGPTVAIAGLVVAASVLVIYSYLIGWSVRPVDASEWGTYKKVPVINKHFRNEKVVLDGKSFSSCTFDNVTFEFNATAPFDLVGNTITGSYILSSNSAAIDGWMQFLKEFRYLKENVKLEPPR